MICGQFIIYFKCIITSIYILQRQWTRQMKNLKPSTNCCLKMNVISQSSYRSTKSCGIRITNALSPIWQLKHLWWVEEGICNNTYWWILTSYCWFYLNICFYYLSQFTLVMLLIPLYKLLEMPPFRGLSVPFGWTRQMKVCL